MSALDPADAAIVDAFEREAQHNGDFAGWLAGLLARAAARVGGTEALLSSRSGSWEAMHLRNLLAGTVGEGDEFLDAYAEGRT